MDAVVKIDGELLKRVEEFVKKNKFEYVSNKQVVNLAIIEFLKSKELNLSEKSSEKIGKNKQKTGQKRGKNV